ncbi:MAG: hypothetical protein DMF87_12485 [Acidobacteria bacterium]|nr:MAG: hypothetical protein DMF88_05855 [Acidobacteriota bacterium]PYR78989.1 MAG: hypothetical protein DMF87_12485 [Acidobacteriota bacterium]
MSVLRGLVGVLVALAVSVGFVQFLELMLANAVAGGALRTLDDYALVLDTWPLLAMRLVVSSFMALLGGYVCAKLAEHDEMRYTLMAVIFRLIAMAGGNAAGYMPRTPVWALAMLLTVSSAAMLFGGAIRAAAAAVQRKKESD